MLALVLLASITQAAWLPPYQVTRDTWPSRLPLNHARCLAAADSDQAHLVWLDSHDGDNDIYYSCFNGFSWAPGVCLTSNSSESQSPCIALDSGGRLHLVWCDYEDGSPQIYHKTCDGGIWSQATKISEGTVNAETPSLAADQDGKVHAVWREYQPGSWALCYRRFDGTAWSAPETLTPVGAYPRFPCIAADGSNNPHVVWQDLRLSTNEEVYFRRYNGATWEPEERLTDSAGLSEYPSVTVAASGDVHVFWDDDRAGTSQIYHRVSDGSVWSPEEIFATGTDDLVGPSCCADDGGNIYAVWYKRGLKYWNRVYCRRFDGGVWLPTEEVAQAHGMDLNPCVASIGNGRVDLAWVGEEDGDREIYWRPYKDYLPPAALLSLDPDGWIACETVQVMITGENLTYNMAAWLAKAGEDSIPGLDVSALSPTAFSCVFDMGPAAAGRWDVVIESAGFQRDTLSAGFLMEQSLWSGDLRLTEETHLSELGESNARRIAVDSHGRIHVVWYDNRDGHYEIYYKCRDGQAWGPDTRLTTAPDSSADPALAVDSQDRLHVVWSDRRDLNVEIYYKMFDGASWGADQRLTAAANGSRFPSIAVDSNDNVCVVWQDERLARWSSDIYFKRFDGAAWGEDQLLYNGTLAAATPTIEAGPAGILHVAWYEGGAMEDANYLEYRRFDGTTWEPTDTLTFAYNLYAPSLAVGPDGSVHVAWYDRRDRVPDWYSEVYYKRYDGLAWGPDQRLTYATDYSQNPSVAVAPDGVAYVVWADRRWGNHEIYQCSFDGTSWTLNGRLTEAADNSNRPSAACDGEGNLHVVWLDRRDGNDEIYYSTRRAGAMAGTEGDAWPADLIGGETRRVVASPNPATSGTLLQFVTGQDCQVRLSICDVLGRLVWTCDADQRTPGRCEVFWDCRDSRHKTVSPGVYLVRLTAGRESTFSKIVVAK